MIPIIGPLFALADTWLEGKQKKSAAKAARHAAADTAKAEVVLKQVEHSSNWDMIMAQGSLNSWKDEYWTIILSIPLIMSFIPDAQPYVTSGFEALKETPEWYRYFLGVLISASVGYQKLINWKLNK